MYHLTIGRKLTFGIAALVLSLLLLSYTSWRAISILGGSLDGAVNGTAKKLDLIRETQGAFQELKDESAREQIAYTIVEMENRAAANKLQAGGNACSACHQPAEMRESVARIEGSASAIREKIASLRTLAADDEERKALEAMDAGTSNWLLNGKQYLNLASQKQFEEAHSILRDKMLPIVGDIDKAAKVISQDEHKSLVTINEAAQHDIFTSRIVEMALILVNLFVAGAVLWVVGRITRTLRQAVYEMSETSERISASANEVTAASQSLAQGASEQAASVEETSASSEEINSMSQSNAANSKAAAESMVEAVERIEGANLRLEEMIASMQEIHTSSGKISRIIRVIDEIAFQTNILALNAAVEAARAGESGMGFAVVADEVRNLAQRSAQAAKDTAVLIEESISRSNAGKDNLDQVAVAVRSIAESAGKAKNLVDEVYVASGEQTRGIEQISTAITQIEKVTQSAAATAEQNSAASHELANQARAINVVVLRMKALVDGSDKAIPHEQLQLALSAHAAWKQRLRMAIDSRSSDVDVETVKQPNQCALGKWLHGGSIGALRNTPEYDRCNELHNRFHQSAARVLADALAGRKEIASRALTEGEFAHVSEELIGELAAWDRKLGG